MPGIRPLAVLLLLVGILLADDEKKDGQKTEAQPGRPTAPRALNKVFSGRVIKIKKKRVTLYYDFEDSDQLKDFEAARPPRLLDASENQVYIRGGRLVLEGSSSILWRMEGVGELRAHFFVRCGRQSNIGTVFTEPVLSDFYVVLNLFDDRFYKNGMMFLAACGLHEDEGAEDLSTGLVNWRDIFSANLKKKVKVGEDAEVEVWKNGWKEYCRVNDVEGKGSSKGKVKKMDTYQFGVWVHHSRATFDDLTITFELTDEFLDLNDLKAEISRDWEEVPETGPLAGIKGVPPRMRRQIEDYAAGEGEARPVVKVLGRTGVPKKAREIAAQLLVDRSDPKIVPLVIDVLYSPEKFGRKLAIGVVKSITGNNFGYSPGASEKNRSKAIQKLNAHLTQNRRKYFGG
jgi:hypothetical protein